MSLQSINEGGYRGKRGFPGSSDLKNLPAMQETQVRSLGEEDPLEKGMATGTCSRRVMLCHVEWPENF